MNFVAIDFETATSSWTSICSMGICVVENNKIVEQKEILVKPDPFEFNDYNILIHGITPDMVINKPTFDKYWNSVKPYIENKLVIAHNASFDVGVLRSTLETFNIEYPTFDYLCTVKLSQKAYPDFPSHKLNNICSQLGISFSHHHAADDAYACANVLLNILNDYRLSSIEDIEKHFEIGIGHLNPGSHIACSKNKKKKRSVKKVEKVFS